MRSRVHIPLVVAAFMAVGLGACTGNPDRATPAASQSSAPTAPVTGKWGFDLDGLDRSVNPGDDFFGYAVGGWIKNTAIADDMPGLDTNTGLLLKSERDQKTLIEDMIASHPAPGTIEQKVADYYSAYMDVATINTLGLAPFKSDLEAMAAAKTHEDVAKLMASPSTPTGGPMSTGPITDAKDPDRYIVEVSQGGLGLPNREFYLAEQFAPLKQPYQAYVEKMLTLVGFPDAGPAAEKVLALETAIAKAHAPAQQLRQREQIYNPMSRQQLLTLAPGFPWTEYLTTNGLAGQNTFTVDAPAAVTALAKLFRNTPVATWRAYMTYHYAAAQADIMPSEIDDANFAFHGTVLAGTPKQRERYARAIGEMTGGRGTQPMAFAIAPAYVQRFFSAETKAQVTTLIQNLLTVYKRRIRAAEWMLPETREMAVRKAEQVRVKVGYPDKWRDYSGLTIRAGDAYGNRKRAYEFEWHRLVSRMNGPVDRDEFQYAPQAVNAYYYPAMNEIVFLAAILQSPNFDPNADPAVNYGGIGGIIGHEMGHGYDDQGAKSDERGVMRDWWQPQDVERFRALGQRLVAQYSAFEPLPGLHVDGARTLGENIGDLSGLTAALDAYHDSLGGKPAPVLDGFTGDQRFFLGWAQVWRIVIRDTKLRSLVATDNHSPHKFRVQGVVRNMDAWYAAFDVKPGAALYLPPEERVHIW